MLRELRLPHTVVFFCLTPPPYTQFRDMGVRPAPRGAFRLRGKEVVFSQGAGFEAKVFSWSFGNKTTDVIRSNCRSSSVRPNKEKVGKGRPLTK